MDTMYSGLIGLVGGAVIAGAGYFKNSAHEAPDLSKALFTIVIGGAYGLVASLSGATLGDIETFTTSAAMANITENVIKGAGKWQGLISKFAAKGK